MWSSVVSWLLIGTIWLITACGALPRTSSTIATDQAEQSLPIIVGTVEPDTSLEFKIAQLLNLKEDSVTIRNVNLVDWPDTCMGLPQTNEFCAQVNVPGFKAIAETPQGTYTLNGDRTHQNFRLMMQTTATP